MFAVTLLIERNLQKSFVFVAGRGTFVSLVQIGAFAKRSKKPNTKFFLLSDPVEGDVKERPLVPKMTQIEKE